MKSYNPFKMWGAWLGLLLAFIFIPLGNSGFAIFTGIIILFAVLQDSSLLLDPITFIALIVALAGFLLGWGIHSIVRVLKN